MLFLQIQTHETNSVSESFFRWRNTEDAALEMMNMSPAILNYTVKFNQTVAAVQYNDTNCSFSRLHCVFISRSLRFFTPESPSLLLFRSVLSGVMGLISELKSGSDSVSL